MKQSINGTAIRLEIEERELKNKINKLKLFTESKDFELYNDDVRELMKKQLKAMKEYYEALTKRMEMMGIEISY